MRTARTGLFLALTVMLAAGCGSDGGTEVDGLTVADLVGTWTATSQTFTNNSDSSETFDFIANGGETRMTVLSHGGARTWVTIGTYYDEWDAQLTLNGNTLTSTPVEGSRPVQVFTITLNGNTLSATNASDAFDFPPEDSPVSATMEIVLERQ